MAKALNLMKGTGTQVPRGWYRQCGLTGAHKQTLLDCSSNGWLVCTCSIQNSGPSGFFLDFLTRLLTHKYISPHRCHSSVSLSLP